VTEAQQQWALGAVRRPVVDTGRSPRVEVLSGAYEMAR
jgi:acyl-CoA dehydrogenase